MSPHQYQELGRPSERPRYLDHLSTREGKIAHEFIRMDILAVDAGEQGFGEAALGATVNQPEPPRRFRRADILGNSQIGH